MVVVLVAFWIFCFDESILLSREYSFKIRCSFLLMILVKVEQTAFGQSIYHTKYFEVTIWFINLIEVVYFDMVVLQRFFLSFLWSLINNILSFQRG